MSEKTSPSVSMTQETNGRIYLKGELSFQTVPGFFSRHPNIFGDGGQDLEVDLDGVSRADSAGIALLVEWQRQARQKDRSICFYNIPPQLLAIARLSGLEAIISFSS